MLLPVLVAILVAKSFADKLEPHSYYHAVMDSNRMPFLAANPHTRIELDLLTVRAVMAAPVQTVPRLARVADIESMLRETTHNGFPVVQPAVEGLVCVGLVTRHVLLVRAGLNSHRSVRSVGSDAVQGTVPADKGGFSRADRAASGGARGHDERAAHHVPGPQQTHRGAAEYAAAAAWAGAVELVGAS